MGFARFLGNIVRDANFPIRVVFTLLLIFPLLFFKDFSAHIGSHFTGGVLPNTVRDQWHIVLLNILFFLTFLIPLRFRRTINWQEYGLVTAFFVSLFIEMYGLPLTIIFLSKYLNSSDVELPESAVSFRFLGIDFAMTIAMVYGLLLMIIGTFLILLGWMTLYRNLKDKEIVTSGIYAYSRHPQYFGFILIILGWLIGWPTLLTLIFSIILIYKYVQVCRIEERELSGNSLYQVYYSRVPFFI